VVVTFQDLCRLHILSVWPKGLPFSLRVEEGVKRGRDQGDVQLGLKSFLFQLPKHSVFSIFSVVLDSTSRPR
jgi:hypothetical protein